MKEEMVAAMRVSLLVVAVGRVKGGRHRAVQVIGSVTEVTGSVWIANSLTDLANQVFLLGAVLAVRTMGGVQTPYSVAALAVAGIRGQMAARMISFALTRTRTPAVVAGGTGLTALT
jgi:low temperature requirement protein LtrA